MPKTKLEFAYSCSVSTSASLAYILESVMPMMQAKQMSIAKYSNLTIGSSLIQWASREVQKGARLKSITEIYIGTIVRTQIDIIKFTLPTIALRIIHGN